MTERRRTRRRAGDVEPDEREPAVEPEDDIEAEDEPELSDEEPAGEEPAGEELAGKVAPSVNGRGTRGRRPVRHPRRPAGANRSSLTAGDAARAALRQIVELTAKEAEGVTGVQRTEDGWLIGVEMVEDRRIPSSADILATYEAAIGVDGDLMSYRRVSRYPRGRGDSGRE